MFILGSIFDLFCLFLVNHMLINSRAAQWSEGTVPCPGWSRIKLPDLQADGDIWDLNDWNTQVS